MSRDNFVDCCSEFVVARGHCATFVVRAQRDRHHVPRVTPIGMMVVRFGERGNLGHEGERLGKVSELKLPAERVVAFFPSRMHRVPLCHFSGA